MYWLVETEEQISYLINRGYKEAYMEVIPVSHNVHPALNDVSLVYFKPSIEKKGFMLCLNHSETLSLKKSRVNELLKGVETLYTRDKKSTLFYFQIKGLRDVSIIAPPYIPELTSSHHILYERLKHEPNVNRIVPIVKHYEVSETTFNAIKHTFDEVLLPHFEFYNNYATLAFFGIEKNGIKIDKDEFKKHFNRDTEEEFVYTSYNFNTLTTRPSNKYDGINYAALNKENGCRKSFIPRNDVFVEYDISAYHPTLSGQLIDYDFGDDDIHKAFASMYGVDYAKAKELTFKQLYGGVFKQYEHLEYFKKIKAYIDDLWENFTENGWIESPLSGYQFSENQLENMNPQKLFNYVLQNLETATNICILMHIHKVLRGKKTKIVLYTYDSFLFDFAKDERDVLNEIEKIFNKFKLNTKVAHGTSYDFT